MKILTILLADSAAAMICIFAKDIKHCIKDIINHKK